MEVTMRSMCGCDGNDHGLLLINSTLSLVDKFVQIRNFHPQSVEVVNLAVKLTVKIYSENSTVYNFLSDTVSLSSLPALLVLSVHSSSTTSNFNH